MYKTYLSLHTIILASVPVSLFNGISAFVDYQMPNPSLYKNSSDSI